MPSRAKSAPTATLAGPDSGDHIQTVTARTFGPQVLQARGPVAVEFMSYSCAYCGTMEPALQLAAQRLGGKEKVCRVNIEAEPGLAQRYSIGGTPTLLMFRNGNELDRVEGPSPDLGRLMATLTEPFGA
ncbi:MAG TPA: thioredoxin family protein [bacterium]|jgi:thioredoxin 1|nr:thioredoxin family protein [bacterium]